MRGQRDAAERSSPVKIASHDAYYTIGVLLVVVAGVCGGITTTAGKFAAIYQVDLTTLNLVRYIVSAAALWLMLPLLGRSMRLPTRQAIGFLLIGLGPGLGVGYGNFGSLQYLSSGAAILLFYTYPMFVVVVATLTGRERATRGHFLAVGMSLVGLVCVVGSIPIDQLHPIGIILALVAAASIAAYIL